MGKVNGFIDLSLESIGDPIVRDIAIGIFDSGEPVTLIVGNLEFEGVATSAIVNGGLTENGFRPSTKTVLRLYPKGE